MSEPRGAAEIRSEIAAERAGLDADLDALKTELRALMPFVAGAFALLALLVFRRSLFAALRMIWRLV